MIIKQITDNIKYYSGSYYFSGRGGIFYCGWLIPSPMFLLCRYIDERELGL